jgi:hypothetical protein
MVIVGGPVGNGPPEGGTPGGAGVPAVGGGVGATGDELPPLEHAAIAADTIRKRKRRNTAMLPAGGASGLDGLTYHEVKNEKLKVKNGRAMFLIFNF